MNYQDAIKDGVKVTNEGGMLCFYPKCCKCGGEARSFNYVSGVKNICRDCIELDRIKRKQVMLEKKARLIEEQGLTSPIRERIVARDKERQPKSEAMLSRATKRISGMADISKFTDAIEKIREQTIAGVVYGSTEEMLVAIELTRHGVKYRQQVKFGPYRVDFVLDNDKVLLEVDGITFHTGEKKRKDQLRDLRILASLGPEWEIIRISDDNINERITRLIPAIVKVIQNRKQMQVREAAFIRRSSVG